MVLTGWRSNTVGSFDHPLGLWVAPVSSAHTWTG